MLAAVLTLKATCDEVRPHDVAAEVNRVRANNDGVDIDKLKDSISSHKAGWLLKGDLELPRKRGRHGTIYKLDDDRLAELKARFGFEDDQE